MFTPPSQTFLPSLVARHETLDAAVAELETLRTPKYGPDSIKVGSEYDSYSRTKTKLEQKYSYRDLYLGIKKLDDYYAKWLCTQKGYSESVSEFISQENLLGFTNSLETVEFLFSQLILDKLEENPYFGLKPTWRFEGGFSFFGLPIEEKEFWYDLIALRGWKAIQVVIEAHSEKAKLDSFRSSNPEYSVITEENVNQFLEQMTEATKSDYESIRLPEDSNGFDFEKLISFAKKYQMPPSRLQEIIDEEFPAFIVQDKLREVLGRVFNNMQTKDPERMPTGQVEGEVSFVIKKSETSREKHKVKLEPKTDPTALVIGKITGCCQFYGGDASDKMVIPVYTDPNAGLITIYKSNGIVGESFAYLTKKDNGEIDGLVLEAYTHPKSDQNPEKLLLPFLKVLAEGLAQEGLKLYLGAFYKPQLWIEEEGGAIKPAQKLPQQKPLTQTYEPFNHSRNVYLIDPKKNYQAKFVYGADEDEQDSYENFILKMSDEAAIKLKESPDLVKLFLQNKKLHNVLPKLTPEIIDELASSELFAGANPSTISATSIIKFVQKAIVCASSKTAEAPAPQTDSIGEGMSAAHEADSSVEAARDDYSLVLGRQSECEVIHE